VILLLIGQAMAMTAPLLAQNELMAKLAKGFPLDDYMPEGAKRSFHKTSRFVINYCLEHKLGHIVIGKNDGWKQEINIGKRNNQNFVAIPFDRLIQQIQYKAQLVGIEVTI